MTGKRILDLAVATLGLVVLSPVLFVIGLGIKLDSAGPVFYRGTRAGKDGTPFRILKFRTMVDDAARGKGITMHNDPRVTRVGRLLRRTKLDELPQLWNLLRGEMSLVGPRPEDPQYLQYYTPRQRAVLTVLPGITSVASIAFPREEELLQGNQWEETYIRQILPQKLELELAYLERRTFWSDVEILGRTAGALLMRQGEPPGFSVKKSG